MSSRDKLIALLVLGGMYFGSSGFKSYIEDQSSHGQKMQLTHLSKEVMAHDEKQQELLARSIKQSSDAAKIQQQSASGFGAIFRHSGDVVSLQIQGVELDRQQVDEAKASTRQSSTDFKLKKIFNIVSVDTAAQEGFTVKVRSSSGLLFKAALYDSVASDVTRKTIQQAEWKKEKIKLHITGRRIGGRVVEARVIQATKLRTAPLRIVEDIKRA